MPGPARYRRLPRHRVQPIMDTANPHRGRPYLICHMTSSVDGRIKVRRWLADADRHYEPIHGQLGGDAWMCGFVTMPGYPDSADPLPEPTADDGVSVPREGDVAKATPRATPSPSTRGKLAGAGRRWHRLAALPHHSRGRSGLIEARKPS